MKGWETTPSRTVQRPVCTDEVNETRLRLFWVGLTGVGLWILFSLF